MGFNWGLTPINGWFYTTSEKLGTDQGSTVGKFLESADNFWRGLDQLDQYTLSADGKFIIAFGVQETNVKTGCTLADTAGCKTHALGGEPLDRSGQLINPQPDVIERGGVDRRFFLGIQGLHQVNLDLERSAADGANVLINILALTFEGTRDLQAKEIDPEFLQAQFIRPADGDLLDAQYFEWSLTHDGFLSKLGSDPNLSFSLWMC